MLKGSLIDGSGNEFQMLYYDIDSALHIGDSRRVLNSLKGIFVKTPLGQNLIFFNKLQIHPFLLLAAGGFTLATGFYIHVAKFKTVRKAELWTFRLVAPNDI